MEIAASALTPELADYLENVEWGYKTGVRYRILDRRRMLEHVLPRGELRVVRENREIVGTLFSLHKRVEIAPGLSIPARYETLLSVIPQARGKGRSKALLQATLDEQPRGIQYAYVEEKNAPSAAAFKALGYEPFGRFIATTLNRLRPQRSTRAKLLDPERKDFMQSRLRDFYKDHALTDIPESFLPTHYWILEKNGQPAAGVQIEEERWSITAMPGLEGLLAVHVLPKRIPVLKISHLYCPPGYEQELMELVMHLTHYFGKKLALAYWDPRSPVYERLKQRLRFGFFNPLFETPVWVWARFPGFSPAEVAEFQRRPFVISPLDVS